MQNYTLVFKRHAGRANKNLVNPAQATLGGTYPRDGETGARDSGRERGMERGIWRDGGRERDGGMEVKRGMEEGGSRRR